MKFWHGDAPPIFNLDGAGPLDLALRMKRLLEVTYVFIKKNGLYFVATTCHNIPPAAVVELLTKMSKVFKDFCGVLNEESIRCDSQSSGPAFSSLRKNFVLVYELLDEMVDYGPGPKASLAAALLEAIRRPPTRNISSEPSPLSSV